MWSKIVRLSTALVLALALCPALAFAEDVPDDRSGQDAQALSSTGSDLATQAALAPAIASVSVDGRTLIVKGANFGASQGDATIEVLRGAMGDDNAPVAFDASSVSWSDSTITLTLSNDPEGIIDAVITRDGATSRKGVLVSLGEDVYENTFARPSMPYSEEYSGPYGASGILKGWGDYLYYLPELPVSSGSSNFAFHSFKRYDVGADMWDDSVADLPTWLAYCSGVMYDGYFVVAGVEYDTAAGKPTANESIYRYDIEGGTWKKLDSTGANLGAGIVNYEGMLLLVGGADANWTLSNEVIPFDIDNGVDVNSLFATLAKPAFSPQLAVNAGQIYVYSFGDSYAEYTGTGDVAQHLQVIADGDAVEIANAVPTFYDGASDGEPARITQFGSIAAATEGLMLVGPNTEDGSTDTYIYDWETGKEFLPYHKRASDGLLYGAAACIHGGYLYATAQSDVEPGHSFLRATGTLPVPLVKYGDKQVWYQGSSEPLVITYTPDASRFYEHEVLVDYGKPIASKYYTWYSGSTVVSLSAEYLSTLSVGEHTETVYFDGKGFEVTATFTVEQATDPVSPGSRGDAGPGASGNSNAQLGRLGDARMVIPFAIIGIGAAGLGIYLVRRLLRNRQF